MYSRNNIPKLTEEGIYDKSWWSQATKDSLFSFKLNCSKITPFSEYIKIEIKTFIDTYNITANIYRIQEHDSIMCEYVCIGSIDFILNKKDY